MSDDDVMAAIGNPGARFTVRGYRGVAWCVLGWAQVEDEGSWEEDWDGREYWAPGELVDSDEEVRAVMVGDDRVFTHSIYDLALLPDDGYCRECGQVGCTHDGRDREWAA